MSTYYNENDPFAAAWLRQLIREGHIADGYVDERSILDVRPTDLEWFDQCHFFAGIGVWSYALRQAGWDDRRPIWTGSCPCQPFSAAGERGGFADERHLWPAFHHLIRECRPGVVIGEQVASKDGLGWLDLVHTDMENEGYAFGAVDLCAAGVGAPHIRQRLWWVAHANGGGTQHGAGKPSGIPAEAGAQLGSPVPERDSGAGGLADTGRELRGALRPAPGSPQPGADLHDKRRGADDGMADTDSAGSQGRVVGGNGAGQRPAGAGGVAGGLAVANGAERTPRLAQPIGDGARPERPAQSGLSGGLADAAGAGRRSEHADLDAADGAEAVRAGQAQPGRWSATGGLADADQHRLQGQAVANDRRAGTDADGTAGRPSAADGFWSDADWLYCRDDRWRPVEPGTFPLVDGAPARVVRLRGYGNAVNAEAARIFIEAVMG